MRNRSCQSAVLPVLEALGEAERQGKAMQLIALDLSAAFDTVKPEVIKEVMEKQGYGSIFVETMDRLTTKGRVVVEVNGKKGTEYTLGTGVGQGDPPSAQRFITVTDPMNRAVDKVTESFKYEFREGVKAPPAFYADDNMSVLSITCEQQVVALLEVFRDFEKVTGLKINLGKSECLIVNTEQRIKEAIERSGIKVVETMRYLGVHIRNTYEGSKVESYERIKEMIAAKCERIKTAGGTIFKKKALINMGIIPVYNHIAMVFGAEENFSQWVSGKIVEALWQRKREGQTKQGRRLIGKYKLEASHEMGGLKLINTDVMAKGLLLNYLDKYLEGRVTGIMSQRLEIFQQMNGTRGLREMLANYEPKIWEQFSIRMQWYSVFWASVFQAVSHMLAKNESSEGWGLAAIAGHGKCEQFISRAEQITLEEEGLRRVEDLFGKNEFSGRLDKRTGREYNVGFIEGHPELLQKCWEM
jgi:hypothetical protein